MRQQAVLVVALALACSVSLWGQPRARGGGSSGGSAPAAAAPAASAPVSSGSVSSGGGTYVASTPSRSRGYGMGQPPVAPQPDPYTFSGQVDMPDGSNPPEPPRIQRVCGSRVDTVAYCDRRGHFYFNLIRNPWLASGDYWSFNSFNSCGLRAYLPGYSAQMYSLAGRNPYAWPSIGKFRLARQTGVEGTAVSYTTLAAPKLARKHFEKALKHMRSGQREKAAEELELAVEEYPDYAAAWALLGEVRQSLGYEWGIREAFERSLEADGSYLRPFAPLIRMELDEQNYEQAAALAKRAVRLNPLSAELQFGLALAKFRLGDVEGARYAAHQAVQSEGVTEHPEAFVLYGNLLAATGEKTEAALYYRRYLAIDPNSNVSAVLRSHLNAWGEPSEALNLQRATAGK